MRISVIGAGYVGLVTGVCFADMGHEVTCVDVMEERVSMINHAHAPIYEEGLSEMLERVVGEKLFATTNLHGAVSESDITFIAVGTPSRDDGSIDLAFIRGVSMSIGESMRDRYQLVVVKSTVVPGTTDSVVIPELENASGKRAGMDFGVCMNPEFLKEGKAIQEFMNPDRVVIGEHDKKSGDLLYEIYAGFKCPILRMPLATAEMIKYASNSFLATKISFINEMARICEKLGVDVEDVSKGIGLDRRIGNSFLNAGPGFGGSCFPKDVSALIAKAGGAGVSLEILKSVIMFNDKQKRWPVEIAKDILCLKGKNVAVLGLAFKEGTDDIRDSPAIATINALLSEGARVRAFDPAAMENAKKLLGDSIRYCEGVDDALSGVDLCIIMTEWGQFSDIYCRFDLMKEKVVVDARRILNPEIAKKYGVKYFGVGYGR